MNPWDQYEYANPPMHSAYPYPPAPPPRGEGRSTAITAIVLSGIGAAIAAVVFVIGAVAFAAHWPFPQYWSVARILVRTAIVMVPLAIAVLLGLGALLLANHKATGRGLAVAGSLIPATGSVLLFVNAAMQWGSDPGLAILAVVCVFYTAITVCALLSGTKRWCQQPPQSAAAQPPMWQAPPTAW